MLSKDMHIIISFHPMDEGRVRPALEKIRAAGWCHIDMVENTENASATQVLQVAELVLVFLSNRYALDDYLMMEHFGYAAVVDHKPFIPVWLDSLTDIRHAIEAALKDLEGKEHAEKSQLFSALEMLTAKHPGATADALTAVLESFTHDKPPYTPSKPQIQEKPCEAYEGGDPYLFISYAHDDASKVYPVVKELHESGWDLWYDEGIMTTERYLPVIADHVKRSAVFVLMLTPRCLLRPFVINYELEYALRRGTVIVPVLLRNIDYIPDFISQECVNLIRGAIKPDMAHAKLEQLSILINRGSRKAIPPAIKQNVIYDVCLPPELPDYEIAVNDGGISIIAYKGSDKNVVVPAAVESKDGVKYPVTSIRGFDLRGSYDSITLPDSIVHIGDWAFEACDIKSFSLPGSAVDVSKYAFWESTVDNYIRRQVIADELTGAVEKQNSLLLEDISLKMKALEAHKHGALPRCNESPYTLICCAKEDVASVSELLIEMYWEGFSILYEESDDYRAIENSACILAFFSENSAKSEKMLLTLKQAVKRAPSQIIQVYLKGKRNCADLPSAIYNKLKDRQAIIWDDLSFFAFKGRLRAAMRAFCCCLDHPRGFEILAGSGSYLVNTTMLSREFNDANGVCITRFSAANDFPNVIIPRTFFDPPMPVTCIGAYAYKDCKNLTSVTIPESVTAIDVGAFEGCRSLASVTIPKSVKTIEKYVFDGCSESLVIICPQRSYPAKYAKKNKIKCKYTQKKPNRRGSGGKG